jgi:hypothetical protein
LFLDLIFLGRWSLPFSQEWWGRIRYEVCGSSAIYRWRESIVSIFMGRNRRPTVPGYKTPTNFLLLSIYGVRGFIKVLLDKYCTMKMLKEMLR